MTAGFIGRDEELAVMSGLLDPAGGAGPVAVSAAAGLPGVGKTALAVAAGHAASQRGWFGGGVLFIDLHGYDEAPVQPGQALDALLRALRVSAEDIPPGTEERAGLYRSVLAQTKEPVLVVADNASSEAQVWQLLPGSGPHRVLVTSRHTLAGLDARLVEVGVLADDAAVELLDAALLGARPGDDRISADSAAAIRLARIYGGLPLALQIVAALLKADPLLTAGELADDLSVEHERLARLHYDDGSGSGSLSVAAAFELSYRRLEEITPRVFRLLPVNPGPDVSAAAVAVLTDLTVREARRVLAGLVQAHLAEAVLSSGAPRWQMHDLLRLYAQRLSDEHAEADRREQAQDRLLSFYLRMTRAADDQLRAVPQMAAPGAFTSRSGALEWLDAERASLVAAASMAEVTGRDQIAMRLPIELGQYLSLRRRFEERLATSIISLNTARRLGDRRNEAFALASLGLALQGVRRFDEAITAHQDAAAIFRETGDREPEGDALNNIGIALQRARRFDESITPLQEAMAIYREAGNRNGEGMVLDNLGIGLRELGRFEEAIRATLNAVAAFQETRDRRGEGIAVSNLSVLLQLAQRYEEAIAALQDAAAIFRETGDRYMTGSVLANLGGAMREAGRFEEAITVCQEATAILRETSDKHGEGVALNNLGNAMREVGRFDEAITAHQDAAIIFRETGDKHSENIALKDLETARAARTASQA